MIVFFAITTDAQVKIGDNPASINSCSILEMESTDKGILIPRMTTSQRDAIPSLAVGLQIYNTSTNHFNFYDGTDWIAFSIKNRENHTLVKSVSDLPAAAGGIITLTSNWLYEINGSISIPDKIDLNGAIIYGLDGLSDELIYTGSSEFFTGTNGGTIKEMHITASAAGAQVFNLSDVSKTKSITIKFCVFHDCTNLGTINGYSIVHLHANAYDNCDSGFLFSSSEHLLIMNQNFFESCKGVMLCFVDGTTFGFVEVVGGFFHVLASNGATAIDFGTGVTVTSGGEVETNFHGDGVLLAGTPDKSWEITSHGVDIQTDDVASANMYISTITM
ncbi:MAG: hypothetical protein JKY54_02950, partial [Flavobacteriales bacterium]|nr:hypothetical protein [Flavobacteriales bacterium]